MPSQATHVPSSAEGLIRRAEDAIRHAREARAKYALIVHELTRSYRAPFMFGEQSRSHRNMSQSLTLMQANLPQQHTEKVHFAAKEKALTSRQIAELLESDVSLKRILRKIKGRRNLRQQHVSPWVM